MTNLLISTFLISCAVFYLIEIVDFVLSWLFSIKRSSLNLVLSTPLSAGGFYLMGFWNLKVIVSSLASALICSLIDKQVNKPVMIQQRRRLDLGL